MAFSIIVTPRAERNLRRLYLSIQAAYSAQARDWYYGLEAVLARLAEQPRLGKVTDKIRDIHQLTYRSQSYSYRIFYRIVEKRRRVYVLHIRHGSRKVAGG